ncbi:MAG: hypothetical protein ACAI43_20545 [Phycisphaerae bacterium]|nr:hypothetical protein [Tepidisphaeraceae bacterium]
MTVAVMGGFLAVFAIPPSSARTSPTQLLLSSLGRALCVAGITVALLCWPLAIRDWYRNRTAARQRGFEVLPPSSTKDPNP